MNKNNCENFMNVFLSLDKHERLPLRGTLHLLACRKCRTEVRLLTLAEKKAAAPLALELPLTDESLLRVIRKVDPDFTPETSRFYPVTLKRWIWSGVAMILAMISFRWFTDKIVQSDALMFAFYLVFGCIVTVYCALFIGSNMDFFVKKISARFPGAGSAA